MVHLFPVFSPLHYASAKRRIKSNPLQIILTPNPKTFSAILKILIQNQVIGVYFIYIPDGEKMQSIASLPSGKHESIDATYKNGILSIQFPKKEGGPGWLP